MLISSLTAKFDKVLLCEGVFTGDSTTTCRLCTIVEPPLRKRYVIEAPMSCFCCFCSVADSDMGARETHSNSDEMSSGMARMGLGS